LATNTKSTALLHGGDASALGLDIAPPSGGWLDLSTGIAPFSYPVTDTPADVWQRLPQAQSGDELLAAAAGYFNSARPDCWCFGAGSQALLQLLPQVLPKQQVAVLSPTYGEHAFRWRLAGHQVSEIGDLADIPHQVRYVVVTNPNNPTGAIVAPEQLTTVADEMARRDGFLLLDEAFADIAPDCSLAPAVGRPGLIVLRSFGKFFGLAGLRLGFLGGPEALIAPLKALLGPWPVSGPALAIGTQAYRDVDWIAAQRDRLSQSRQALDPVLRQFGEIIGGTDLFRLLDCANAQELFLASARSGILLRRFEYQPTWLRIGLPGSDEELARLAAVA
jgi:cobalamin biosynthetic protein CobC